MKKIFFLLTLAAFTMLISCSTPPPAADDTQSAKVELVQTIDKVSAPILLVQDVATDEVVVDASDPGAFASAYDFIETNWGLIASILFLISELVGGSKLQSNSIFQLVITLIKKSATRVKTE